MFPSEATFHLDIERKAKTRAKIWVKCFNSIWKKLQRIGFVCFGFFGGYVFKFSSMKQSNNLVSLSPVWNIPPHPFHSSNNFAAFWALDESPKTCQDFCFSTLILPVFFWLWYSANDPPNDPTKDWHLTTLRYNFKLERNPLNFMKKLSLNFFFVLYFF